MTFATEFPDFPAADLPAIPAGFSDTSWHNNSAPSFENRQLGLSIWIDYADPAMREHEGGRFMVNEIEPEDGAFLSDDPILETDDWSEVEALITARTAAKKPTRTAITPQRKALALAVTVVSIWKTWRDDAGEDAADDALRLAFEAAEALDMASVDGRIASPLRYFARAYLGEENPEDLTFSEMTDSLSLAISQMTG